MNNVCGNFNHFSLILLLFWKIVKDCNCFSWLNENNKEKKNDSSLYEINKNPLVENRTYVCTYPNKNFFVFAEIKL